MGSREIDTADALLTEYLGDENPDEIIPTLARDERAMRRIEALVRRLETRHELVLGDARQVLDSADRGVHLVLTSPPYWTLKRYNEHEQQLGHMEDYGAFLDSLDAVWERCFRSLAPGGRLVCVVGDVCLSRRRNAGRHTVVPLHAAIQERCRRIGFDNLALVVWHKIANATYEVGGGGGFLGKPYEPNAVIKNDIEFILMQRKPGGYRNPSRRERLLSMIPATLYQNCFRQIWQDINGESTRNHPAPFPLALAERLIRMFSFVGDTVLDPFMGTATTNVAAAHWGRNSLGIEVDPAYFRMAQERLLAQSNDLFKRVDVVLRGEVHDRDWQPAPAGRSTVLGHATPPGVRPGEGQGSLRRRCPGRRHGWRTDERFRPTRPRLARRARGPAARPASPAGARHVARGDSPGVDALRPAHVVIHPRQS